MARLNSRKDAGEVVGLTYAATAWLIVGDLEKVQVASYTFYTGGYYVWQAAGEIVEIEIEMSAVRRIVDEL